MDKLLQLALQLALDMVYYKFKKINSNNLIRTFEFNYLSTGHGLSTGTLNFSMIIMVKILYR